MSSTKKMIFILQTQIDIVNHYINDTNQVLHSYTPHFSEDLVYSKRNFRYSYSTTVANFILIGKAQIPFPLVRFALKWAIMLHSVTSYKLIVASVVRKTGESWGTTGTVVQERESKYQNTKPTPY